MDVAVRTNTHQQQRVKKKYALIYRTIVCDDDCILYIVLVINVIANN
jgi:hypothetical protein